jgi:putative hydrolase
VRFFGDYHVHSTYSDGRGTVAEMVEAGQKAGLEEIGFAEHGPRNIGCGIKSENMLLLLKEEIARVQRIYPAVKLYTAVEANVISLEGELDVSGKVIKQLDYLIAGLHPYVLPAQVRELSWVAGNTLSNFLPGQALQRRVANANTKAFVAAIYRYAPQLISHPGLRMPISLEETARACLARGTWWEINAGHRFPDYEQVSALARWGVDFLVNSDAHFPESVGALDYGAWVLEKARVPLSHVKNARS